MVCEEQCNCEDNKMANLGHTTCPENFSNITSSIKLNLISTPLNKTIFKMSLTSVYFLLFMILLTSLDSASAGSAGCPVGCICNDDTFVVQCERSKLDVIPITLNPAIQRLVLRTNKIKTIDAAFQFYKELQYVDLSNNHLVNIPMRSFINQEKLQELHLNKNKLSSINNKTFHGLKSLTVLNLRENFLEELPKGLFSILPKLEELNLGQNRISKIDPLAFDGLFSLRVLYLDDNSLSSVPTHAFSVLGSLAELHVGLNGFTSLQDDAFSGLGRLSVLDISSGGLSNISTDAFRGLTGLRSLNLADNRLQTIPTIQLAHLARLEDLTIGQNEFVRLKKGAFKGLTNLRKIDITGASNLEYIEKGAYSDNLNLETIILVSNKKLTTLEDGALVGLPNLKHLVLRENNFRTLSESVTSWNELRALELTDNPINCDCQLLWLLISINSKNITNVQCHAPLQLRDRSLRTLTPYDLGCSFRDSRQQTIIITFCVSATIFIGILGLFLFRYRQRVGEALKDYKWNKRAISRKEHEYQKTFSDEDYITRSGHHNVKPIPVTEL
ncbi:insulin-like growth factor-binding protein complex acid labile subunit isoform X2 [Diorhabda sublineata]|uniref:insulin-like growth factor-binding protein complex acid labile subunit isoform X2 n=1 Tax=Diorhabda sublineata TaxID=1163346 RepID=UPI0024E0DBB8|nr:insulin-like growth factor-binding protein complex acid labile subunit isoform X2 [Diorhabda sublineata]